MAEWAARLNKLSRRDFYRLFAFASVPLSGSMGGYYRASFVGPTWLRLGAGPAIAAGGLSNWWGKRIDKDGSATNLIWHEGKLVDRLAMHLIETNSFLDGRHTLALIYSSKNPFPWPYVVDELRRLEAGVFLGMTHVNTGPLRQVAFPFLLEYQEQVDGP